MSKNCPGYAELLAYAKAEQTLADVTEYSEESQAKLRKALEVPPWLLTVGDHLELMRKAALKKAQQNQ